MTLSAAALAFAEAHRLAHLATCGGDGQPHVVPICYAVEAAALHFVVDEKPKASKRLRRLRNLEENPRAAVVIDDYDDEWRRLAYLLLRGTASVVRDPGEYQRVVALLRARYGPYRAMPLAMVDNPLVRIAIESEHFWSAAVTAALDGSASYRERR